MKNKTREYSLFLMVILFSMIISNCANKGIDTMTNVEAPIALRISSQEAFDLIERNQLNKNFIIIDVRTQKEYNFRHINKSKLIDFNSETFGNDMQNLDKYKTYLIYCRSGGRSSRALSLMSEMGFIQVYEINGGINDWINNKLPVVNE